MPALRTYLLILRCAAFAGWNVVHLINAWQYVYSWYDRKWWHPVLCVGARPQRP